MASIPVYQRQYTEVPELRAPRAALKGAFPVTYANEATLLSHALMRVGLKIKNDKDDAWVSKALATTSESYDAYTFGGGVAGAGVYNRRGEDAVGSTKEANEVLQQSLDEIVAGAPSKEASQAFLNRARSMKIAALRNVTKHEMSEVHNWNVSSSTTNAASQMKALSKNFYETPELVEEGFTENVVPELERLAKLQGVPSDSFIEANRAKLYDNIITQNIAVGGKEGVELAADRLKRWGDDLTRDRRASLTTAIRTRKDNIAGQEKAEDLIARGVPHAGAMTEISKIENLEIRKVAKAMYNAHHSTQKQIERMEFLESVDSAYTDINGLAGDLAAQQLYISNMKIDTAVQRAVKVKATSLLNQYKSAKNMQAMTDPLSFDNAVEDIAFAEVTDPAEIVAKYGDKVTTGDLKKLEKLMTDAQSFKGRELHTAFSWAIGSNGEPELKLSEGEKRSRGAFVLWATEQSERTNRADDPGYAQKLADLWVLQGEVERSFTPGYGANRELGEAIRTGKEGDWLPGIGELEEKTTAQIQAIFTAHPEIKLRWLQEYEGDEELAIRAYYGKSLMSDIGPRPKGVTK